jgi:hypothetical protein
MTAVLSAAIILLSAIAAYSADNLTEKYIQELSNSGVEFDNISEDMLKAATDAYKSHLRDALPQTEKYYTGMGISGDNITFGDTPIIPDNQTVINPKMFTSLLGSADRLYVFMSASVPEVVWKHYADSMKYMRNASIVLRGCIGGCGAGLRPTYNFLRSINPGSAMIDPLLFRLYDITEVPAVVYATGVPMLGDMGSEGNASLLPNEAVPVHRKSIGDWSFEYHLDQLGLLND